jgi:hypothetical protein
MAQIVHYFKQINLQTLIHYELTKHESIITISDHSNGLIFIGLKRVATLMSVDAELTAFQRKSRRSTTFAHEAVYKSKIVNCSIYYT